MINVSHLKGLETHLLERIKGQADAMRRLSQAVLGAELDLNDRGPRPPSACLLMGQSGCGKTESVKALSGYLFGPDRLTLLFMNQMQREGSADGFAVALAQAANGGAGAVLCDEIEKASRPVSDVLMNALDEGQILLPDGKRAWVANLHFFLTSNVGSRDFHRMTGSAYSTLQGFAYDQAREHLRPELFNRFTETIVYRPLTLEVQEAILEPLIEAKLSRVHAALCVHCAHWGRLPACTIDPKTVLAVLLHTAFSPEGGARGLREELNRQFNAAVFPAFLEGKKPVENRFYGDLQRQRLVLS